MSPFDIVLVQPIFNILISLYALVPGHNFGLTLIIFTVLVRLIMWPLVKKQLHQTKVMRRMQPEMAKIKQKAKGNKQLESQLMMELYRERGVNPFSSIGLLLVQLPIFIALYAVVGLITKDAANIGKYTYDFLEQLPGVQSAMQGHLDDSLFGLIDLTKHALGGAGVYWPLLIMAIIAAGLQFVQSRQLMPKPKEKRRLRDILKDQAAGRDVDQSEISALMTSKMSWLFPILTFGISIYLEGALVLYLVTTSAVAIWQQHIILNKDETELEKMSDNVQNQKQREKNAKPAEVVAKKGATKSKRRKR